MNITLGRLRCHLCVVKKQRYKDTKYIQVWFRTGVRDDLAWGRRVSGIPRRS